MTFSYKPPTRPAFRTGQPLLDRQGQPVLDASGAPVMEGEGPPPPTPGPRPAWSAPNVWKTGIWDDQGAWAFGLDNPVVRVGEPFDPAGMTVELSRGAVVIASQWPQAWCRQFSTNPILNPALGGSPPIGQAALLARVDDEALAGVAWVHTPHSGVRIAPRDLGTITLHVNFGGRPFTCPVSTT